MLKLFAIAVAIIGCAALPALACIEPLAVVHDREIGLVEIGLKKLTAPGEQVDRVKDLRDRSEVAYKAHHFKEASTLRHAALVALGYKYLTHLSKGAVALRGMHGCAGAGAWIAPSS
jgi:hypothetical protein